MMKADSLPRVLIIDDLFGRTLPSGGNEHRANLCANFMIRDITGDETDKGTPQKIMKPIADAVFFRGQHPTCSQTGDTVENDLDETMRVIESRWTRSQPDQMPWSLVLLDLCFYTGRVTKKSEVEKGAGVPEGRRGDDDPKSYFGLKILAEIQRRFPDLPVIILSSKPRHEVARDFSYLGALDFLPRGTAEAPDRLEELIELHGLIPDPTSTIVGRSRTHLLTLRAARRAALDRRNVLIRGETGTGKDLLAKYINQNGPRQARGKIISVNSASLSPELYASELFGHVKGAFTGAVRDREGRISQADGGDLFLDEIGSMPLDVQAGILRALECREVVPVGSHAKPKEVDIRFIFATNEDIDASAASGRFRSDLLYRLRETGELYLPPLREHMGDGPLLVEKFVREAEAKNPRAVARQIDDESLAKLAEHSWPGNIRELRNCIFSAVNSFPGVEHLAPVHLTFDRPAGRREAETPPGVSLDPASAVADRSTGMPHPTLCAMADIDFESVTATDLAGRFPEYVQLLVRFLRAALIATTKQPGSEQSITRAVQLITGSHDKKTGAAADLVKRIMNLDPEAVESLLADPVLKEAHDTAVRLRPGTPRRRPDSRRHRD